MGILDSVIGGLLGGGTNSPMGAVLGQILGGGGQGGGMFGGAGAPASGGLGGLIGQLRQAGLGQQVDSWIGPGQNQPVSPQQLNHAFGEQQVSSWASQAGMGSHDFLSQLAQHLPNAVDGMTPGGRVPDEGTVSV